MVEAGAHPLCVAPQLIATMAGKDVVLLAPVVGEGHKPQAVMEVHLGLERLQAEALVLSDREDKVDFGKLLLVVVAVVAFMAAVAVEMMVVAPVEMVEVAAEAALQWCPLAVLV